MITSFITADIEICQKTLEGWWVALFIAGLWFMSMALNWYYIWKINKMRKGKKGFHIKQKI